MRERGESSSRIIASRSIGGASSDVIVSVAAATSDRSGARMRSVPSSVTSARDRIDEVARQADAELGQRRDEVLEHRRLDGARWRGRARPSGARARARDAPATPPR